MWQLGWMLSLIPDSIFIWVTYFLFGLGVALYVASKMVTWIPMIKQYKLPAELVGVVLLVIGSYLFGGYGTEMSWRARVADLEAKLKLAEEKSQQVNTVIQEKIIYKTKIVEKKTTEYVDRIKEIAKEIDAKCEVDPRVIDALNKASEDPNKEDVK
jgi:hypothetical protein